MVKISSENSSVNLSQELNHELLEKFTSFNLFFKNKGLIGVEKESIVKYIQEIKDLRILFEVE